MSVGSTFLSAIRVGIVLLMMCVGAYAFDTEASYYTVASCLREGTSGICANGEKLDDNKLTCASWDYKFGTILKVTNKSNGKYIYVRVNDRGPNKKLYRGGRKIDLSKKAYKSISSIKSGVCQVSVEFVK
jgi:rare lipoprotein A